MPSPSGHLIKKGTWYCCCGSFNIDAHCPVRCSICGHEKCSNCRHPNQAIPNNGFNTCNDSTIEAHPNINSSMFSYYPDKRHHDDCHEYDHNTSFNACTTDFFLQPSQFNVDARNMTNPRLDPILPFSPSAPAPDFPSPTPTSIAGGSVAPGTWICPRCKRVNSAATAGFCSYGDCQWRQGQDP